MTRTVPLRWLSWLLACSSLSGCDEARVQPREDACGAGIYGQATYDALAGDPSLFRTDTDWVETAEGRRLLRALRDAGQTEPTFPTASRIALQNDVWGLWQRVEAMPLASTRRRALLTAAERVVRRLAPDVLDAPPRALPPPLREGWRELESEMPTLQHERLFGLRRVFRIALRTEGRERALFSQLVAIDRRGRLVRTEVFGDLEMLELAGDELVGARLFELDRRALRCGGPALVEATMAHRVPGLGANGFLATFEPPAMLQALPCRRCHDDGEMMSLPSPSLRVGARHGDLLEQARSQAPPR